MYWNSNLKLRIVENWCGTQDCVLCGKGRREEKTKNRERGWEEIRERKYFNYLFIFIGFKLKILNLQDFKC